ncbi:hypothetical protein AMECASPLE_033361 [Ameca splendens]|uniref:Uncharacterized protein n=1 Tax=Ameca splendens TaxID=208324 RepID=A0ABV0XJR2_9TELE
MQANRSRPSTTHQPPRCSHKMCSPAPPAHHGPEPQKEAVEEGYGSTSYQAPCQPHPQTPGAPQSTWRTTAHQAVHQASPSTSQSMLAKSPLPEPGAEIQGNPSDPERERRNASPSTRQSPRPDPQTLLTPD